MPPDAAAIHAAERARGAFESRRPLVRDPELAAGISEIGLEAIGESPLLAARDGEEAALKEGWRFLVLDDPEPEAFLFADRTVFVSRGALAALPGEPALVELFRSAATTFASGAFRPVAAGGLIEQPVPLVLPADPDPESPAAGVASRDRWADLLDGLLFGEPAEFGVADGSELLLPQADVRFSLPEKSAFEAAGRGVFRATRGGEPLGLTVRETVGADAGTASGSSGADAGGMASNRAQLADLGARLRATADCRDAEATFIEAFRVRGFTAVRSRLHPVPDEDRSEGAGESPAEVNSLWWNPGERRERRGARLTRRVREEYLVYFDRNATQNGAKRSGSDGMDRRSNAAWVSPQAVKGACGEAPSLPAGSASEAPAGLIALFRSEASLVEVSLECARRRFDACEALFLDVLGSADRLWDTPVPGPLRITALAPGEAGSVRDALRRLAAEGRIDGPFVAVEFLNRGWLDEQLGPGDRVLILSRSRQTPAPREP